MSFYSSPPYLYLGGGVVRSDWDAWQEAMKKFDGKIDTIVFHDSGRINGVRLSWHYLKRIRTVRAIFQRALFVEARSSVCGTSVVA